MPRDEAFSESKEQAFKTKATLGVLHAFLELMKTKDKRDLSFPSLAAIDALFEEGFTNAPPPKEGGTVRGYTFSVLKEELGHLFKGEFGAMKHTLDKILDFETPEIRQSMIVCQSDLNSRACVIICYDECLLRLQRTSLPGSGTRSSHGKPLQG